MGQLELTCTIVGEGRAFNVTIDDGNKVSVLKNAIKEKNKATIQCHARDLQLFLAKQNDAWLDGAGAASVTLEEHGTLQSFGDQMDPTLWVNNDKHFGKNFRPGEGEVHVLVVVPGKGKRCRADGWFGESFLPMPKKRRVDEDEIDHVTRFFGMRDFPPLAHKKLEYDMIMERKAYRVIFTELMNEVQSSFGYVEPAKDSEPGKDSNLIVTGNLGVGKSRFYLYCIFQLILCEREDVKKLPPYELVLNYGTEFHKYDAERKEFVELDDEEVVSLQTQRRVLRLVEATSAQLAGWSGVSILFAAPGVKGMNNFAKVDGWMYIMPAWTLEELREYNSLLLDKLKLADDDLVSRYDTFGGIPRFVFTRASKVNGESTLKEAVNSFSAMDIISYARSNRAVKEDDYSHRVLEMVPTRADFCADYRLDFLFKHIAELVVARVHGENLDKGSRDSL